MTQQLIEQTQTEIQLARIFALQRVLAKPALVGDALYFGYFHEGESPIHLRGARTYSEAVAMMELTFKGHHKGQYTIHEVRSYVVQST